MGQIDDRRVVVLARHIPYPPTGGAALRNWQNINILSRVSKLSVFTICPKAAEIELKGKCFRWQHVDSHPTGWLEKAIGTLNSYFWPIRTDQHPNAPFSRRAANALAIFLQESNADLLIVEELWLYPYISSLFNWKGAIIYDAHNVEGKLRSEIESANSFRGRRFEIQALNKRVIDAEKELVSCSDQIWVCSDADRKSILKIYGNDRCVEVVPNTINPSSYESILPYAASKPDAIENRPLRILFTAVFGYRPNSVAAGILIEQILPLTRKVFPTVTMLLVGRSPTTQMLDAAANDPDIVVTGEVPDVLPYLKEADVVVVPLQHGGGTRLKILEAFAARRPVVSTQKGAEGLEAVDGEHILIANTPEAIAQAVARLAKDADLANRITNAAYALMCEKYSWNAAAKNIDIALSRLSSMSSTALKQSRKSRDADE